MVVRPQIVALRSLAQLAAALEGLTLINQAQIQEGVRGVNADLQAGRITYARRDLGEEWLPLLDLRARGAGDCEDLSAAIAAELRHHKRIHATAHPYFVPGKPGLVHVVVKLPDGRTLDPSRTGGMVTP